MPKIIPDRPLYRRERIWVGYPLLAIFALLFAARLTADRLPAFFGTLPAKLCIELLIFFLPLGIFIARMGRGYLPALRLRAPRAAHAPLLISGFFALLCGCLALSSLCGGGQSLGNSATVFDMQSGGVWLTLARVGAFALVPAFCEELCFRGVVCAEYERRGAARAALMSTVLFALLHFDARNLPVYLFSGLLFALVLFATDSLFSVMILHALYNVVSLLGQRYLNALYAFTGSPELFLFLLIAVCLLSLFLFARFAARLYREADDEGRGRPRRDVPWNVQFYTILDALSDPPFLAIAVLSIVGMIVL